MRLDESFMLMMKTYLSIVETKGYLYWHEGFYKMSFDYSTIKKRLRDSQSPVYALYDIQFAIPESGNDLEKIVRDIESAPEIIEELSKKGTTDHIEYEVKAFFHRVFTRSGMNPTRVAEIVKNYCKEKLGYLTQDDTGRTSSFFVLKEKVRIIRISSVAGANGFIRVIDKLIDQKLKSNGLNKDADQGTQLFYRGQGDLNYILEPSLFRRPGLAEHESEL